MELLRGKRGLIVGVANNRSIAWGIAKACRAAGAQVAMTYQGDALKKRVEPLAAEIEGWLVGHCDVTDPATLDAVFEAVRRTWGKLDFLVHAVAYSDKDQLDGRYIDTTAANFTNALSISCYSLAAVARRAEPLMPDGGSILTLTYYGAEKWFPHYNVMGVAKAALEASVRYLAVDLGESGVRVNAISAGPIKTLAFAGIADARYLLKWAETNSPMRRNVTADDVGDSAVYLLSDFSRGVTGEIHPRRFRLQRDRHEAPRRARHLAACGIGPFTPCPEAIMSDIQPFDSLIRVGRKIRDGQVSSVAVTAAQLDRIAALDGRYRSYATVTGERALARAEAADREIANGVSRGPLHGVPIAVKDLCRTQFAPTGAGTTMLRGVTPDYDCTVVERLEQAGAVILGKLAMTEGAYTSHHPDNPGPLNPWGADHWVGSSSTGSGVATAAGLCYGSLGSDTGGSIRFPSATCGLTGLKPTWGRVSRYGVYALADSLDHVGPMTRSAADAAAMLGAIAGADPRDPTSLQAPVPDYSPRDRTARARPHHRDRPRFQRRRRRPRGGGGVERRRARVRRSRLPHHAHRVPVGRQAGSRMDSVLRRGDGAGASRHLSGPKGGIWARSGGPHRTGPRDERDGAWRGLSRPPRLHGRAGQRLRGRRPHPRPHHAGADAEPR